MRCLYCGTPLAIMRTLASGMFCSDEHHELYENQTVGPDCAPCSRLTPPAPRPCREVMAPAEPRPLVARIHPAAELAAEGRSGPTGSLMRLPRPEGKRSPPRVRTAPVQPISARPCRNFPALSPPASNWRVGK